MRQLGRLGLAARAEREHRLLLRVGQPALAVVGHAAGLEVGDQQLALDGHERARARRLHDRRELGRHDEHRAPHAQQPHERALLVERVLDRGDRRLAQSRAGGEEDARRVGRVQAGDLARDRGDVLAAVLRREAMAQREPRAALVVADRPHAAAASCAPPNGSIVPSGVTR